MEAEDSGWDQVYYRQGSVLSGDVATRCLGINNDAQLAIFISHDCDIINNDIKKEPFVEVIIAQYIPSMNGNFSQAKNPRLLHLEFTRNERPCYLELIATNKRTINKSDLVASCPDSAFGLSGSNRKILQNWLAARYRRHAFPGALNHRLDKVFENNFKRSADEIFAVFIDYQPRNQELSDSEPYELWIYVVADTSKPESIEKAKAVTQKLKEALHNKPKGLDIRECEAVTDTEFTLADARRTEQFRLEFLSFRHEPFGSIAEH